MCRPIPRRAGWRSLCRGILPAQPDVSEQLTGPSLKVAYKDGQPTAGGGGVRAQGRRRRRRSWRRSQPPKGEYLAATVQKKGRTASEILAESLPKEIAGIYWAKNMYWRGKSAERFVRPVRWMVSLLDERSCARWSSPEFAPATSAKAIAFCRPARSRSSSPSDYVDELAQGVSCCRRRGARAAHSQGARRRDANHSRRALARRQAAAGHRRQPHRVSLGHSRQLRSRISRASRGSAGHGDARSPEVFRAGRCRRQAAAALPGGAEYRRRSRRTDPARQRARAARPLQRCALLLADRPENLAARSRQHAEDGHLPEGPGQLLRQDLRVQKLAQPDLRGRCARRE